MPRTETTTRTLYKFSELSPEGQEKALDGLRDVNLDEWWEAIYEDARNVGLEITGFDVGRGEDCTGDFISGALDCAHKIEAEHGKECETYKTAKAYLASRDAIDMSPERNEWDIDADLDELDAGFLKSLLGDYLVMLRKDFEYQQSDEAVRETIDANEYEFTEDGGLA